MVSQPRSVVFLFCHAAGLCAEVWEPVIRRLQESPELSDASSVEFMAFTFSYHGDRRDNSTPSEKYYENGKHLRIKHPANNYPQWGPVELYDKICEMWAEDDNQGCLRRSFIGIGHSLGAASLWQTEVNHPGTFDGLVLFEPMSHHKVEEKTNAVKDMYIQVTLQRRREWESREAAQKYFASYKYFSKWHPEALAGYVKGAVVKKNDDPNDQTVVLACTPEQECGFYSSKHLMMTPDDFARPQCPIIFYGGANSPIYQKRTIFDPIKNKFPHIYDAMDRIPNVGHLSVLEDPDAVSNCIVSTVSRFEPFQNKFPLSAL